MWLTLTVSQVRGMYTSSFKTPDTRYQHARKFDMLAARIRGFKHVSVRGYEGEQFQAIDGFVYILAYSSGIAHLYPTDNSVDKVKTTLLLTQPSGHVSKT